MLIKGFEPYVCKISEREALPVHELHLNVEARSRVIIQGKLGEWM